MAGSRWMGEWPLVGREEELALLRRARVGPRPAVVLGGHQGVGKSRLAAEALAQARADRWAVDRVDGATATAAVPLGAVAHLASPEAARAGDPLGLLTAIVERLRERAARRPLMILIDDAPALDEASLALLRRATAIPQLFLLLTMRTDEAVPTPIVELWKDGLADRVELTTLTRDETYRLVGAALGGEVDARSLSWLWNHSLGNPLFLRELVLADGGSGWRRGDDGAWHRQLPDGSGGPRLAELVRSRLDRLSPGQRRVLELLAVAGTIRLDQLAALASLDEVAAVADRGLVAIRGGRTTLDPAAEAAERDAVVGLAHPLYGIVLTAGASAVRARDLRRQVLDVLRSSGAPSPGDVARIAALELDLGQPPDTQQLVLAANLVVMAYPRALAERLSTDPVELSDLGDAAALADVPSHPSGDDLAVMERLARTAWHTDRTLSAGLTWAAVLVAMGRAATGEALMTELEALVRSEWDRTWVVLARAALTFWVRGRADDASDMLAAAESVVDDADAVRRLRRERAGIALNVGRVEQATEMALSLVDSAETDEPVAVMAAATAAAAIALAGRPVEAAALVDRFLPAALAQVDETPEVPGQLMLARQYASRLLGALDEAEWVAYACYQAAVDLPSLDALAVFTGALGQVALDQGRLATAARRLRESEVLLRERDVFGYRPWVLACLSMALAQSGQVELGREAAELARATATQARFFDPDVALAEAWCQACDGRVEKATELATAAADMAADRGLGGFEAAARHALTRFGRPGCSADRLHELAVTGASPLWRTWAAHARASAAGDAAGLEEVATSFEGLGTTLLAAEALAQAAALHQRRGAPADAFRSGAAARALAAGCQGARTPPLRLALQAPTLTRREREVAVLAADGLTSKAIAERLFLSHRTVESHLYRIFTKLGVTDRTQLGDLLGRDGPA